MSLPLFENVAALLLLKNIEPLKAAVICSTSVKALYIYKYRYKCESIYIYIFIQVYTNRNINQPKPESIDESINFKA